MLQILPSALGRALHSFRAGIGDIAYESPGMLDVPPLIELRSPSFADCTRLPQRCTADGAGLSPALSWRKVPADARALVLMVEDADSPTPRPIVHAIAFSASALDGELAEGELSPDSIYWTLGNNSRLRNGWLPCDPPPGHGEHRYCFQLFALDRRMHGARNMGRGATLMAMRDCTIAKGLLIGNYGRA